MTAPTPEQVDAVARVVRPWAWMAAPTFPGGRVVSGRRFTRDRSESRLDADRILTTTDPAAQAALAASLPAEVMLGALVRAGVLTEEWAVQYECDLSTPMMSGETERTITTQVPSEDRARRAVRNYAPINARNRRAASRLVTPWEVAP